MQLVPFKPFSREIGPLEKEMENLWKRFFGETTFAQPFSEKWAPTVDVSETKDKYLVKAELPGLDAKDVNVKLSDDILTIKGEKKKETEDKDENHYFSERYYGNFQRSFQLPASVKADKIEASFNKGVLKVTLPTAEEAKKKEIEVKVK